MRELDLGEIQRLELKILEAFDAFCKEHGLTYYLCAGTLLGAVRHKGFIPWDDDVDVCMARPEYERMLSLFPREHTQERYYLVSANNGLPRPFARILDRNTKTERELMKPENGNTLWIDVFPVDGLPSTQDEGRKLFKKKLFLDKLLIAKLCKPWVGRTKAIAVLRTIFLKPLLSLVSTEKLVSRMDALAKARPFESSEYVGIINQAWRYADERLPRSEFEQPASVTFEGREYACCSCWEQYLVNKYGDYMQLPPEDKRQGHSFEHAWLLQDE